MKKIQIEKIEIKENIRKDYGDLTELAASVRIHGIRNPVELNSNNELVDGFRRVRAAKAAGLTEIPYFVNEELLNKTESQLISGMFQKNLNPIEEGQAFKVFMDKENISAKELAKKISKKTIYIEKRLELVKLPSPVRKALIKKEILMGHALLLAKLPEEDSKKYLKEIIDEEHSVQQAKEELEYSNFSMRLKDAKFCKNDCKDCKYNGSKQAELFETGTILNGNCMNPICFKKKLKQFIEKKSEEFKDVLYEPENSYASPTGYIDGSHEWDCKDKGVTPKYKEKCKKDRENYLVQIYDDGRIVEYFRIPSKKKTVDGKVQASTQEEAIEERREQTLISKINEFKSKFLIDKSIELMVPGTREAKALTVVKLIQGAGWSELDIAAQRLGKLIKKDYGSEANVKNIFAASEKDLDKAIVVLSENALSKLDLKNLITTSREFKVDIKKHFQISEDYLKLYTKDQLGDLGVEFKLDGPGVELKKDEIIAHILNQKLTGRIPKILL